MEESTIFFQQGRVIINLFKYVIGQLYRIKGKEGFENQLGLPIYYIYRLLANRTNTHTLEVGVPLTSFIQLQYIILPGKILDNEP